MSLQTNITALAQEAQAAVAAGERWERIVTAVFDAFCDAGGSDASRGVQRASGNYRQRRKGTSVPLIEAE